VAAVRFGLFVPQGWIMDLADIPDPVEKYEAMTKVAQAAERVGFDSIWLFDHFHTYFKPVLETTFECWTTTAALARDTSRIRIGQMVTCNGYRNPALMAKMASTVDVLSHGRLDFGIGAGWYEHEYKAYGYDYPTTPDRLRMLREGLEVITRMWTEPYATFSGEHYRIDGAINEPKGVQKPHPPIWVGGAGEKVTLKLAAQYGNATNFGGHVDDMDWYRNKLAIVRGHCEAAGRDFDAMIHSTNVETTPIFPGDDPETATALYRRNAQTLEEYRKHAVVGGAQEIIDTYGKLIDAGMDYIVVADVPGIARHPELVDFLGSEVLPAFR
jgi:F420-dependent oxidoreductase-like protein